MTDPDVGYSLNLRGRRALVTGASRGIGAETVRLFAASGAKVFVHYRNDAEGAAAVVEAICASGGAAVAVQGELTDDASVARMFYNMETRGARVDVVVNNAGAYSVAPLVALSAPNWSAMFEANLKSAVTVTRCAALSMKAGGGGAIVNIGSLAAHSPQTAMAHYSSAKAALLMFTRAAAQELGPYGIRVNSVSPGLVARNGIETSWPEGVTSWRDRAPMGRLVPASHVARTCLFLASSAATTITGQDIAVDAGMSCAALY